jgi:glycosidase
MYSIYVRNHSEDGTLEDFKELIEGTHNRDMKLLT